MAKSRNSVLEWAKKTTSTFAGLLAPAPDREEPETQPMGGELIYRLRHWPRLPERHKTAGVYRALSVMSSRPVNRSWILRTSGMSEHEVDAFLGHLVSEAAVDVVDPSGFGDVAQDQ